MTKLLKLSLIATIFSASCTDNQTHEDKPAQSSNSLQSTSTSEQIVADSANKMIKSYLTSINYTTNDTNLRSLIFDAAQLRDYLNSTSAGEIARVKIMFAHTLAYINSGHKNQPAGYKPGALTLVIAGIDESGNYVYIDENEVLDFSMPCPTSCPTAGNAARDTLVQ
jgi:hypothetical protein